MNEQTITLDLDKRPSIVPVLYIRQGDKSGTQLKVDITKDGSAFALGSYGVKFCLRAPKGKGYYEVDGTASGNRATFTIDETYAGNYAGTTDTAYVEILEEANVIASTANFRVVILQSAEDGADPNGAWKSGITEAVEAANAAVARADAAAAAVEDATEAATQAAADASAAADAAEAAAAGVDDATAAATAAASSAQASSSTAASAASSANAAAAMATEAADNATDMLIEVSDVTARAEQAIAGMGDISELAVPLMTEDVRGGAKVGQGLHVEDGSLSLGPLVREGNPTHGCALYAVEAQGWAEQDGTPTPENPVPIEVCRGRNLLDASVLNDGNYYSVGDDGAVTVLRSDGRAWSNVVKIHLAAGTYTISRSTASGNLVMRNSVDSYAADVFSVGNGVASATFTLSQECDCAFKVGGSASSYPFTTTLQVELGSTPTPYVPYGHVGMEVQGRNLFDKTAITTGKYLNASGVETSMSNWRISDYIGVSNLSAITISGGTTDQTTKNCWYDENKAFLSSFAVSNQSVGVPANAAYIRCSIHKDSVDTFQLEYGATASDYVPYSHTTTPIPLPLKSDGERWAGGLPDGTADALSVDSAGRYVWTLPTKEEVFDGSSDEAWNVSNGVAYTVLDDSPAPIVGGHLVYSSHYKSTPVTSADTWTDPGVILGTTYMSSSAKRLVIKDSTNAQTGAWTTWLAAHSVTVLYPIATPTTEEGYIDQPSLPDGATVDIPELTELGVSWWVKGAEAVVAHASNERRRIEAELDDIREAIADL